MCFECPGWEECPGCTFESKIATPTCEAPLEHTTAEEAGVTLETLNVTKGFWRANNRSDKVLACYNEDACSGGQTGADNFCANGYSGPCEEERQALSHAPLLFALFVFACETLLDCLSSHPYFVGHVLACVCARFLYRLRCVRTQPCSIA